jgi:hypothetical protein
VSAHDTGSHLRLLTIAAVAGLCLGDTACAAAQDVAPAVLDSGKIVRVHLAAGEPAMGRLLIPFTPASTSLRYCAYKSPGCRSSSEFAHEVPRDSIVALDVRSGSNRGKGALIGAAIGGGLGLATAVMYGAYSDAPGTTGWGFLPLGIIDGALVGWIFGSASPQWKRIAP